MTQQRRNELLALLHRYNGWNLLFLTVTGIVLYLPALRTLTAPFRVPLKWGHIASGCLMVALLLAYVPLLAFHWLRLQRRSGQQLNVVLLVTVTAAWAVSGMVLWFHQSLPPAWAAIALTTHDYTTWLMLPWLLMHSVTRYFKLRLTLPRFLSDRRRRREIPVDRERRAALGTLAASAAAVAYGLYGWRLVAAGPGDGPAPPPFPSTFDTPHPELTAPLPPLGVAAAPVAAAASAPLTAAAPAPAAAAKPFWQQAGQPPFTQGDEPLPVPLSTPPSGGGRKGNFRIYTVTDAIPAFQPDKWRFFAKGLVSQSLDLSWREFLFLPRREQVSDFHCVTGWSVNHITWEGVKLGALLDLIGVKSGADHVKFYSLDSAYTDDLSLDVARQDDIMLAYMIDGQLLPQQLGGPLRLIVPRMYAYKSVKWLGGIELIKGAHTGFWEERGYSSNAWVRG